MYARFSSRCTVASTDSLEQELNSVFGHVFYEGMNMVERDWLLFWRFLANHDFRKCFIYAKYIGWEDNPKQMVVVIQSENPFQFYNLSAKKSFFNVILIGKNEAEIDRFLKLIRLNSVKLEINSFSLVSNGSGKDLVIKRITQGEVLANSYSLANYSSFDGIWLLDANEYSLKIMVEKLGAQLPANIPKMGITFERVYERLLGNSVLKVVVSLDDQIVLDESKLGGLMASQSSIMVKRQLGFAREFVRQNEEPEYLLSGVKFVLGLGVGGLAIYGAIKYFGKSSK